MKEGDVVYNEWHGIRRYGIVSKTYVKEGQGIPIPWTYAEVKWINDKAYESVVKTTDKLRNYPGEDKTVMLKEYRVDKLQLINLEKEINTLWDIARHLRADAFFKKNEHENL